MKKDNGFTLMEALLVILLIGIVGFTSLPLFNHYQFFQERFFLDEFSSMLRYAHQVAMRTGCEVQVGYKNQNQLALFQRQNCQEEPFTRLVKGPSLYGDEQGFVITLGKNSLNGPLPIYIATDGKVYNSHHQWQRQLAFQTKDHQLIVDGFSGFVYEQNKRHNTY